MYRHATHILIFPSQITFNLIPPDAGDPIFFMYLPNILKDRLYKKLYDYMLK